MVGLLNTRLSSQDADLPYKLSLQRVLGLAYFASAAGLGFVSVLALVRGALSKPEANGRRYRSLKRDRLAESRRRTAMHPVTR